MAGESKFGLFLAGAYKACAAVRQGIFKAEMPYTWNLWTHRKNIAIFLRLQKPLPAMPGFYKMDAICFIAEQRIEQAIKEGLFDNLPGMGKPLVLEDLSSLPPELRMAYTILKNSGYIEKKPEAGKALTSRELLEHCPDERQAYGKIQKFNVMMNRVHRAQGKTVLAGEQGGLPEAQTAGSTYVDRLVERV